MLSAFHFLITSGSSQQAISSVEQFAKKLHVAGVSTAAEAAIDVVGFTARLEAAPFQNVASSSKPSSEFKT
jgi:hypothetical protein